MTLPTFPVDEPAGCLAGDPNTIDISAMVDLGMLAMTFNPEPLQPAEFGTSVHERLKALEASLQLTQQALARSNDRISMLEWYLRTRVLPWSPAQAGVFGGYGHGVAYGCGPVQFIGDGKGGGGGGVDAAGYPIPPQHW